MEKKQISIDYPTAIARLTKFVSEKVTKEKKVDTELLAILRTFIEIRNISYVNPNIKREIKQSIEQAFNSDKEIAEALTGKDINEVDTVFIKDSHFEVTSYKPSDKEGTLQQEPKRVVVECEKKDVII